MVQSISSQTTNIFEHFRMKHLKALTFPSLVITLTLMISACGWHLRGVTPLPKVLEHISISSRASQSFNERLEQQLSFNGSQVFHGSKTSEAAGNIKEGDSQPQPKSFLSVSRINVERRTLSINSLGQAAEYELDVTLNAQLITPNQDYRWELNVNRTFTNDSNNVVATETEQQTQILEIEQQLVNQLMRRLQKAQ